MATIRPKTGYPKIKVAGISSTYTDQKIIDGAVSESDAISQFIASCPASKSIYGLALNSVDYDISGTDKPGKYNGTVSYKHVSATPQQDAPASNGDEKLSFSFSGGQTFFNYAISQTKHNVSHATITVPTARDFNNLLDVKGDPSSGFESQGIEAPIPSSGFQVRTRQTLGANAAAVNAKVRDLIGVILKKNDASFRGLNAGECLLLGFSGEERIDGDFDMTYDFAVSLQEDYTSTPLDLGNGFTSAIGKIVKGFELIWIFYETYEDTASNTAWPMPTGVYVADVFEDVDFSTIGIAT